MGTFAQLSLLKNSFSKVSVQWVGHMRKYMLFMESQVCQTLEREREREREYMEVQETGVCCGARETEKEREDNLLILQKGKAR